MWVYAITNRQNNKMYIGQTIASNPNDRWSQHKYEAASRLDKKSILYKAIRKYGADSFDFTLLYECSNQDSLNALEQGLIKQLDTTKNGYNISYGGSCGKRAESTIRKIKEHWTLTRRREHAKQYVGEKNPFYGKTHTKDAIEINRQANIGNQSAKKHRIIAVFPDKSEMEIEGLIKDFCSEHNLQDNKIYSILAGRRKTHKGFTFYTKDEE